MPIELQFVTETRLEYEYVGSISDREFDEAQHRYLAILKKADAEGRRIFMLVDGSRSDGMSASQRKLAADFSKQNAALIRRVVAAQAVVLISAIQRGVLTAIVWLNPPPALLKAFPSRAEGNAFLDEMQRAETRRSA